MHPPRVHRGGFFRAPHHAFCVLLHMLLKLYPAGSENRRGVFCGTG